MRALFWSLLLASGLAVQSHSQLPATPLVETEFTVITNLAQLTEALDSTERLSATVRLEVVVCAASRPELGVLAAQDDTGTELLEMGRLPEAIQPGERLRIQGERLLLRRRETGVQISTIPVVDNDGAHAWRVAVGEVELKAGWVPVELDWFNYFRNSALEAFWQTSNGPPHSIPASAFSHVPQGTVSGQSNVVPGLHVASYEGNWLRLPDFDLLRPLRSGTATNLDLGFRTRDELVGLRFTGFLQVPRDGKYSFALGSDDGSLLFIGPREVPITRLDTVRAPTPDTGVIGEPMARLTERRWLSVQGRVSFISRCGEGFEMELRSGAEALSVRVIDAAGHQPSSLLNTQVRVVGLGIPALSAGHRVILDRLLVPDGRAITQVPVEAESPGQSLPLLSISQVQTRPVEEARRELPVRIRGVVTGAKQSDHWISIQDDTRGIFIDAISISNSFPNVAEVWEVTGHTAAGNFAPIVVAERATKFGQGHMPEPVRPTWSELANGSMDVQWVEFQGLVAGVSSNILSLRMPEGPIQVQMENYFELELRGLLQAVVRIRGTLFAVWNAYTREVQSGIVLMRDASVSVDTPALADLFDAQAKSARDLLQFDAHASVFRPIKVRAQVLFSDARQIFATDQGMGLRVQPTDQSRMQPGDLIEAVGYPEIGGPSPVLREAVVRKTGTAQLPVPRNVPGSEQIHKGLDATWIRTEGRLIGLHQEQQTSVLEMQSAGQLFVARVLNSGPPPALRLGSKLQLTGVYAELGRDRRSESQVGGFELLLNAPSDIQVLSQPSWWTLERLGVVVGLLVVVLLLAAVWITQLHRQVEQRSAQLRQEIRERERAEHHHALEAERSRIARDLHDDLGSSLTEISALAGSAQPGDAEAGSPPALLDSIADKARDSIAALDVIVWAVNPEHNSLQSVADYLSGFAGEYLSHANIACRFKIPVTFPPTMLEGKVRHDIFLSVKETLHNIVRHAAADEVEFRIASVEGALEIVIADNGRGFDPSVPTEGNGLKNLRSRLSSLGGTYDVTSRPSGGTEVCIRLPPPVPQQPPAANG